MKIHTSNFSKLRGIDSKKLKPISITRFTPKYFKGTEFKKLAPKYLTLMSYKQGILDDIGYIKEFNELLNSLDPVETYEELKKLSNNKDIILTCYCGTQDFCHRHIIAEWLESGLKKKINELGTRGTLRVKGKIINKDK